MCSRICQRTIVVTGGLETIVVLFLTPYIYELTVSSDCNSWCILIGGDTIRQLQVECGAHIELHRGNHPNPNEKLFNIRGSCCYYDANNSY